ncbi:MAG TPA: DUF6265 family protein [Candidatus Angelobacter sp.]|nr:DUF6265 family protein [Candidatus Angelobacter sp.]
MKSGRTLMTIALMLAAVMAVPNCSYAQTQTTDVSQIKPSDFSWFTGRWIGHMRTSTAEQICSTPESGELLCLFRVFVRGKPVMYEIYSLYDTPAGPEVRSLHFSTDLADKTLQAPLVMKLQKYSDKEIVFAGGPGSGVETSVLLRDTPTTMNGVIMFRDQKISHIQVRWEKVAYDAKVDYNPAPLPKP